ncbi:MAG: biopolymer transporter ExbD [Opitutaceae bacterium]
MRTRRNFSEEGEVTDINISPLIDMVFILLIFFIVTTVFVEERGMAVNKPSPVTPNQLDKDTITFKLTASGQVLFKDNDIGIGGVRGIVRQGISREQLPVIINVAEGAVAGLIVRVIDESKVAGAQNISLSSE